MSQHVSLQINSASVHPFGQVPPPPIGKSLLGIVDDLFMGSFDVGQSLNRKKRKKIVSINMNKGI